MANSLHLSLGLGPVQHLRRPFFGFLPRGYFAAQLQEINALQNRPEVWAGLQAHFDQVAPLQKRFGWAELDIGFDVVLSSIGVLSSFFMTAPIKFNPFGWYVGQIDRPFAFFYMAFWLLLAIWQWRVLKRPNIKALFSKAVTGHFSTPSLTS